MLANKSLELLVLMLVYSHLQ
uniref:Uncharacterized protein n=1 Tax=Arundo donax TaxID=35708 RepID=A0A0A9GST3_ARUDO